MPRRQQCFVFGTFVPHVSAKIPTTPLVIRLSSPIETIVQQDNKQPNLLG